jgi:hypothetical protein
MCKDFNDLNSQVKIIYFNSNYICIHVFFFIYKQVYFYLSKAWFCNKTLSWLIIFTWLYKKIK